MGHTLFCLGLVGVLVCVVGSVIVQLFFKRKGE